MPQNSNVLPLRMHLSCVSKLDKRATGNTENQERKRHTNINVWAGDRLAGRGVSQSGVQGSKIHVLSSEPKEHKSFCAGARPGRLVAGVTGQSFMC